MSIAASPSRNGSVFRVSVDGAPRKQSEVSSSRSRLPFGLPAGAVFPCLFLLLFVTPLPAQNRLPRRVRSNVEAEARNAAAAVVRNLSESAAAPEEGPAPEVLIPVAPDGSVDPPLVAAVRARFAQHAAALNRQRAADGQPPLPEPPAEEPRATIDMAHYGIAHHGRQGAKRFFALHLLVDNPTAEAIVVSRSDITAKIDGETRTLDDVPDSLKQVNFSYGTQHQIVQLPEQVRTISAPAGGVAGSWLLFAGLPMNADVPDVAVQVRLAGKTVDIDVTALQRALLELRSEAMGPRGCLRLLTIHGLLNSVNLQSLVQELERAVEKKSVRFVLQWRTGAPAPDHQLSFWLVNSAAQLGTGRPFNDQYPSFPAPIREFHFVQPAGGGFPTADQYGRPNAGLRMHAAAADAVAAALKTAFVALPPEDIVAAIKQGNPLARAAALRHGAGKLHARHLSVILPLVDDSEVVIQTAAVRALGQFGEPAALDPLVRLARGDSEPLRTAALEGLAGSRYAVAHRTLLELLERGDPALKRQIMQVLARYPRPQWSQTIYAYVTDPKEGLPIDGVRALLQVGHPRLVDILEAGLKSSDQTTRDLVFPILAQRTDSRSERLATDYVLARLEQQPPDATTIQFLHRTKLAEAVPLLLKHLDSAPDKGAIINLLAQIGDESVGDSLVALYPKLQSGEKSITLNALRTLRHAKFRDLAAEALLGSDAQLINQATQGLIQDGGTEACRVMIAALHKQTNSYALSNLCNALANLGSPEARRALLKARESDNPQKQTAAIAALRYFWQRSPGYQYIWQAQHHTQNRQWKEALEYFELSLQLDPELPEAYAGRGSMRLRLGKTAEATSDFEKAYELDPFSPQALTGLAIVRVQAGKIDEGLKLIEGGRERNQHDVAYLYNSACVYAQAMEQLGKDQPDERRDEYRKKALADLQNAVSHGFSDYDWMRDDPDFQPLKNDPEFQKLAGNRPAPPTDRTTEEPADADPEER
jgi:HEAT repeat protein